MLDFRRHPDFDAEFTYFIESFFESNPNLTFIDAIKAFFASKETINIGELHRVSDQFRFGFSQNASMFLYSLLECSPHKKILCLSEDLGYSSTILSQSIKQFDTTDISIDHVHKYPSIFDCAKHIKVKDFIRSEIDDTDKLGLKGKYDCIIHSFDYGLGLVNKKYDFQKRGSIWRRQASRDRPRITPKPRAEFKTPSGSVTITDEPFLLELLKLSSLLDDQGVIFALVPEGMLLRSLERSNSVFSNLMKFDLHISGVFNVNNVSPRFTWGANFCWVVIRRVRVRKIFIAEVKEDLDSHLEIRQKFLSRKNDASPLKGRLISLDEFVGVRSQLYLERYQHFGKRTGLEVLSDYEVMFEIGSIGQFTSEISFDDKYVIYFSNYDGKVTTTFPDVNAKWVDSDGRNIRREFHRLVYYPEVVDPEYFLRWMESPIGVAYRRCITSSTNIVALKKILSRLKFYFAPKDQQHLVIDTHNEIQNVQEKFDDLESSLWLGESAIDDIREELHTFREGDPLEDWVKTLPFPLASILYEYMNSDNTAEQKCKTLSNFFEAYARLCAIIHLSAIKQDVTRWSKYKRDIKNRLHYRGLDAGFGAWREVTEYLGSRLRNAVDDPEQIKDTLELYAATDTRIVKAIGSSEIFAILQRMNKDRNDWDAHGGRTLKREHEKRLKILERELENLRSCVGMSFKEYKIVKIEPDGTNVEPEEPPIFKVRIRELIGPNQVLPTSYIRVTTNPFVNGLYMYSQGGSNMLPLLPLMNFEENPISCIYFYDKSIGTQEADTGETESTYNFVTFSTSVHSQKTESSNSIREFLEDLTRDSPDSDELYEEIADFLGNS